MAFNPQQRETSPESTLFFALLAILFGLDERGLISCDVHIELSAHRREAPVDNCGGRWLVA